MPSSLFRGEWKRVLSSDESRTVRVNHRDGSHDPRISAKDEKLQKESKVVYVFIRKVESENGITLPFTFVGTGQLHNPRKDVTTNGSILYDILMDNPLPDDLMEDFQWIA